MDEHPGWGFTLKDFSKGEGEVFDVHPVALEVHWETGTVTVYVPGWHELI